MWPVERDEQLQENVTASARTTSRICRYLRRETTADEIELREARNYCAISPLYRSNRFIH